MDMIEQSDAVIFSVPCFQGHLPGILKNFTISFQDTWARNYYPLSDNPFHPCFLRTVPEKIYGEKFIMSEMLEFADRENFRKWLNDNCLTSEGVWLLFGKSGGSKTVPLTVLFGFFDFLPAEIGHKSPFFKALG